MQNTLNVLVQVKRSTTVPKFVLHKNCTEHTTRSQYKTYLILVPSSKSNCTRFSKRYAVPGTVELSNECGRNFASITVLVRISIIHTGYSVYFKREEILKKNVQSLAPCDMIEIAANTLKVYEMYGDKI